MALFGRETQQDRDRAETWARWFRERNPYAIASTVLGVFSLLELGALIIPGIASIALGAVALQQLGKPARAYPSGHGLAWFGIFTSVVSLVIAAFLYLSKGSHA